jgi:hypothetical protein
MINLDPMNYKYGTSYTEEIRPGCFETRNVTEVFNLTIWEALRMLMSAETRLWRMFADHEIPRDVAWRSWCSVKEAMYHLLRDGENAYLKALANGIGIKDDDLPPTYWR